MKRILIIKPSSLGDVLQTFPAVARLAAAWPEASFDWLIHPGCAAALDYAPVPIARRILFKRKELASRRLPLEMLRLIRELRRERYDLAIDFQGLFRSAFFGYFARGRNFAGFAEPREKSAKCFYTRVYPVDRNLHAVERNWQLAGLAAGLPAAPVAMPPVPVIPAAAGRARDLLRENGIVPGRRFVAIAPGARWPSKKFPPGLFAQIAAELRRRRPEVQFAVVGTAAETADAGLIAAAAGAADLTGKTDLRELMEILRLCDTLLCNDSGPMHLAAALGKPTAVLFGPTRPGRTGPWGAGHIAVSRPELDCLGCLRRTCPRGVAECHEVDAADIAVQIAEMWKD